MTIKLEIEAAGWPEIYITNFFYDEESIKFSFYKLKKAKKNFSYLKHEFHLKELKHFGPYFSADKDTDVVYKKKYGMLTPRCLNIPSFSGKIKNIPFDIDAPLGEIKFLPDYDVTEDAYYFLDFSFESEELNITTGTDKIEFVVGKDIPNTPDFMACQDGLSEFQKNFTFRKKREKQIQIKNEKQSQKAIKALKQKLLANDLIRNNQLNDSELSLSFIKTAILEYCSEKIIEIPAEDIGTVNTPDIDYLNILRVFQNKSEGSVRFDNLSSSYLPNEVSISFIFNDEEHLWNFEQHSDHLSEEFFSLFMELQNKINNGGFIFFDECDYPTFMYVKKEIASLFQSV